MAFMTSYDRRPRLDWDSDGVGVAYLVMIVGCYSVVEFLRDIILLVRHLLSYTWA